MEYLVTMEWIDPMGNGAMNPPQQMGQLVDQVVVPSLEAMVKLRQEKKIVAGGALAGKRGVALIVEAESNDEVAELTQSFPFWVFCKWEITPLETLEHHVALARQVAAHLNAAPHPH